MENDNTPLIEIRDYLKKEYGIFYSDKKLYSLKNKLSRRLNNLGLDSLKEYLCFLEDSKSEVEQLLNEVSTNKTHFFRESGHWDFIINKVITQWKDANRVIKAWSAPCSTGEEPYSLAMLFDDCCGNSHNDFGTSNRIKILGSDVANRALRKARKGVYSKRNIDRVLNFSKPYKERYFKKESQRRWAICDKIKDKVTFRKFNLNSSAYPNDLTFDLIMCRNVLIYFKKDTIQNVVNGLSKCLRSGAYLIIGNTESLHDIEHDLEKIECSIFRKP